MTFALVALGSDRVLVSVSARSSWLEWSLDDLISLGWRLARWSFDSPPPSGGF
jgi:hypothetical protein